jgi:hypothetical protein
MSRWGSFLVAEVMEPTSGGLEFTLAENMIPFDQNQRIQSMPKNGKRLFPVIHINFVETSLKIWIG